MVLESDLKVLLSSRAKKWGKFEQLKRNKVELGDEVRDLELNSVHKIEVENWINHSEEDVHVYERKSNTDVDENEEDSSCRKRKWESYSDMLNWVSNIAKNPCDPTIGSLPETKKWNCYGSDQLWKQFLLVREAMLKRSADDSPQQSVWQKKQKMHPRMYDDRSGSERLRCSHRLVTKDSVSKTHEHCLSDSSPSGCGTDEDVEKKLDSIADSVCFGGNYSRKKGIRIGPQFQIHVPLYTEQDYKCDSKWLDNKIWPLEASKRNKGLIEREPIGRGRQESCGCQFPSSIECVKFHIREKRKKLELELGSAFDLWKFNLMGEEVASSWRDEDEKKFKEVVESNRLSSEKYFWDELFKCFPKKGREALVSFYFNVFLLRLRGQQNRDMTSIIHSDDEESGFGPVCNRFGQMASPSPGSIFSSPKKTHRNRVGTN